MGLASEQARHAVLSVSSAVNGKVWVGKAFQAVCLDDAVGPDDHAEAAQNGFSYTSILAH